MSEPVLNITKAVLPPIEEYIAYLEGIWARSQLTNHGPLAAELEVRLREALGVRHLVLLANGTLALQIAIRALRLEGEVITTPFSYVATTSALVWEHARPVFVDIEPRTFTIDAERIEDAVTAHTSAILATHVYGFPCDVDRIGDIADRHGLTVVYDAAHAFGVLLRDRPLVTYGDASALSFHATKVFHTVEGGAVATNDDDLAHRVSFMRNHGHRGQEEFWGIGINAKASELHAAMGLCLLPRMPEIIATRRERVQLYRELLAQTDIVTWDVPEDVQWNYGYFPVVFDSESTLVAVKETLMKARVHPRRYFYPSLTALPYAGPAEAATAESVARRVLCLPLYGAMRLEDVERIAALVVQGMDSTV